jgi:hypothetical protein
MMKHEVVVGLWVVQVVEEEASRGTFLGGTERWRK